MPPVSLSSSLYLLQQYGPVAPSTLTAPVRAGLGKYGDGLFVEEGTTNLVTNPSFETGTAGVSSAGTIAATFATSTARAFIGSQSLQVTPGAGAGTSGVGLGPVTVAAATTYTVSLRVWLPAGAPAFSNAYVNDNATAPVTAQLQYAGANANGQPLPKQQWVTLTGTITTGAGATQVTPTLTMPGGSPAFYIDAVQVEQKGYATSYCDGSLGAGYAWTGAANASTSTRAAGQVTHPVPSTPAPLTVCAWVRVGEVTGAEQDVVSLTAGTNSIAPALLFVSTGAQFSSKVDVNAQVAYTPTAGDLLFLAGTLAADGKTYSVFLSRNGGAVTSATSAASATAYTGATTATPGSYGAGTFQGDSVVEQVLLYNRVLTPTEISNLAFNAGESTFASDPGIVYAAACGPVRGTTNAHTLTGTGLYRAATSSPIACYVEPVPALGPDAVASATKKISVAAGSGIGQGQLVSLNAPTGGNVSTVLRVFSPGGDYDELYTT